MPKVAQSTNDNKRQQNARSTSINQIKQQDLYVPGSRSTIDKSGISSPPKSIAGISKIGGNPISSYHQKVIEERNPYKFIEKTLIDARQKLEKMRDTPKLIETLGDNTKKKKFLKAENKQLRDQLKKMSENVNLLIDKMNQESLKKKRVPIINGGGVTSAADPERPGSQKIKTRQKEIENTDKAI